jgi:nicotinate-nucleotide adenylyltransferase
MGDAARITRLGVLGGTFDPPHYGHLLLADTARVQLRLDRVLIAPAGQPPHKPEAQPSSRAHRVALVKAALLDADEPAFRLSRVDLDRPGPHYTMETLTVLREQYPEAEIWFLIGGDSLADLAKWRAPSRIIALARLGVLARPGYAPDLETLSASLAPVDGSATAVDLRERIDWLHGPALDISSSALRERARRGFPLRFLVPPSVEAYICEHQLYGVGMEHKA